jgi:hypothetical protein
VSGYLVHPTQPWAAGVLHTSDWVAVPPGCVSVRCTITPEQSVRGDPRLGCEMRMAYLDASGLPRLGSGCGLSSRVAFADDEPIPTAGHEVGSLPGVVPAAVGGFDFEVCDSIGVQQGRRDTQVAVQFSMTFGDAASVNAAIVFEAFDSAEQPIAWGA